MYDFLYRNFIKFPTFLATFRVTGVSLEA